LFTIQVWKLVIRADFEVGSCQIKQLMPAHRCLCPRTTLPSTRGGTVYLSVFVHPEV
jgi:hypothetical protein